ncbi:CLUMA_CG014322, isoform A [Clunio marinus]|uniref:CLUMA_CG014322, isoform A n=1 Tax=Clunio marinus TaxID=568069 RepID=A0A1J1ILK5_9DIPT|nr:CLUMA_CG014322, isoform A [Clunio marinus]
MKAKKRPAHLITAGERDLLREEFLGIMYSNFLSGKDSEFFDYDTVDKNEEYDDTLEVEQDFEDKYFEGDDSNDSSIADENQEINEESEDELDIYMKHLENNLKREENEKFHEEFDE